MRCSELARHHGPSNHLIATHPLLLVVKWKAKAPLGKDLGLAVNEPSQ